MKKVPKLPTRPPKHVTPAAGSGRSAWQYRDMGHYKMPMHSQYVPKWVEVLSRVGWPTDVVVLDFETYFDDEYGLKGDDLSTIEYVTDPRFEQLCVSVLKMTAKLPFAPAHATCWMGEERIKLIFDALKREYGPNLERCTLVIQNARFDATILMRHHGINAPYILDLLGLAAAWNTWARNRLGDLCKRFNLPAKGDTKQFKGMTFKPRWAKPKKRGRKKGPPPMPVRMPMPSDDQVVALADYANNDTEREWELFTILLPLLSRPDVEIPLIRHTLGMYLEPSLAVDYARAEELLVEMQSELDKAIKPSGLTDEEIRGGAWDERVYDALVAWGGEGEADYFRKPAANCKRKWKIKSAKSDPERAELMKHADETVRTLMVAKAAMDSWPNHMSRVRRIVAQCKAFGGLLPVPLFYHGAHTGRWSGGEKINLQNLSSRGLPLVNAIREILIAPEDMRLVIVDLSAVEARGVAYIAGEADLVQKFRNNEEIYCRFAELVLGLAPDSLRKPKPTDPPGVANRLKHARNNIGKIGVLGCGYGMGPDKAEEYAKGAIDSDTAKDIVSTYRLTYRRIVKFWYDVQKAFIYATKYDEPVEMPRGLRFYTETEPNSQSKVTIIRLPSGRELKYHHVSIKAGNRGDEIWGWNEKEHKPVRMWGGHLTENIVQAMCRDALADSILSLAESYIIPLHVHDEIITLVKQSDADTVLDTMVRTMSRSPEWAPGFPLGAEGLVTTRYGGH